MLDRYFGGINSRNYSEWASAVNAQEQANNPPSSFASGYATTKDSGIVVDSITDNGDGTLTVSISFTSHQAAANSVDGVSTCNHWQQTLPVVPQGSGFVVSPPSSADTTHTDC
jgi:hypothetical protein